jgi:23S rRNA pseudouridine955/2504/2580 synthase
LPQPEDGANRQGVRHIEIDAEHAGRRLDQFLLKLFGTLPRSRVYRLVRKGEVRINGHRADPAQRLAVHDKVRIPPVRLEAEGGPRRVPRPLLERLRKAIIVEEDRLLVIDKPSGIAVHGGSGVSFGVIEVLRALRPEDSLELVHRLDRDTSGCLLVARKASALRALHALLREGQFEKRYLALVKGHWQHGRIRVDVPLRTDLRVGGERTVKAHASGKASVSEFRPLQFFGKRATLMEVSLHTGRTHQIRVHAAHSGHALAGDEKYGDPDFNRELAALGLKRMFLHAHSVGFDWPQGGAFSASAPLPADLAAIVDLLTVERGRVPPHRTAYPPQRKASAPQMSGSPKSAVGSLESMRSKRVMPRDSALKLPAQSNGCSRSI